MYMFQLTTFNLIVSFYYRYKITLIHIQKQNNWLHYFNIIISESKILLQLHSINNKTSYQSFALFFDIIIVRKN